MVRSRTRWAASVLVAGMGAASGSAVLLAGGGFAAQAAPLPDASARCRALATGAVANLVINQAELVAQGPMAGGRAGPPGAGPPPVLPEHCLVRGVINPRKGHGGRDFGIGFELRLPSDWNGRFLFQGGGGLDGAVQPALGNISSSSKPPALVQGFAVASTDSGHSGSMIDASFGVDQQARTDYAYNALDKVTTEAKRLLAAFYGTAPNFSYFLGCSNGGRQALMASQRLPLQYDGIVAGDPAMGFSRLALGEVWNMQVVARIAPKDPEGRPIYAKAFSDDDLKLVRSSVLAKCDALDGLGDGMINDWRGCGFDPAELTCRAGKTASCLTSGQVGVLQDLHAGPRAANGEHVYGPFTYDTGIGSSAWRGMRLGTSDNGTPNSADSSLGLGQFRFLQLTPAEPDWDPLVPYEVEDMLARIRYTGGIGDADSPLLSTFALKGKMIVYNGLSDQGMSTPYIANWYERMLAATGPAGGEAVRLFAVPGMLHCGGGESTDRFEMLDAIMAWVEQGRAPDRIIATGTAMPGLSRPLCPHPQVARYKGGDTASAESFACES